MIDFLFIVNNLKIFLFILLVLLGIILFLLSKYKSFISNKLSVNEFKNSHHLFIKYLDSFYVTNKYYTFFALFCYYFYFIFMFIIIRIIYLGYVIEITAIKLENITLNFIIIIILILSITIIFRALLQTLFYKEILKLYIYLWTNKLYRNINHFYDYYYLTDITGPLYLFFYCVATLKDEPSDDDDDYQEFYVYKNIYEHDVIKNWTKCCVKYTRRYFIVRRIFIILCYICSKLYKHLRSNRFSIFIFYIIFFIIMFYDFINFKLYYTYYYFFIFYIVNINFKYMKFLYLKSGSLDHALYQYFYKNSYDYSLQRDLIKNADKDYYPILKTKSKENMQLNYYFKSFYSGNNLIKYVHFDLQNPDYFEELSQNNRRKINKRYFIFFFLIIFIIIFVYFVLNNNTYYCLIKPLDLEIPVAILYLPVIMLLIYLADKSYMLPKDADDDCIGDYIYNKYYAIIFWVITLLQSILLILFFYYTNILELFTDNDIINNVLIVLRRDYTLEEKQQYFLYLFDNFILENYLIYGLEELELLHNLKTIILDSITENTQIEEIKETLSYIYSYASYAGTEPTFTFLSEYYNNLNIANDFKLVKHPLPIMQFIKNTINILVFWNFLTYNITLYLTMDFSNKEFLRFANECCKIVLLWWNYRPQ